MTGFDIEFWHWWVLALALAVVEMVLPGAAFIWLGLAAGAVGLGLLLVPDLAVPVQFGAFAVLAIAAVVATRFIPKPALDETDQPNLNRRAAQYVGRQLVLESAIVNGRGRAFVGDTLWSVAGDDLPVGTAVKVVAADGALLRVERA